MDDLTHSEKQIAEKTVCVLLIRGKDEQDQAVYAYVAVRADKLNDFIQAQQEPGFRPEDHAIIIESGTGEPSATVRQRMETEYGFKHDKMVFLSGDSQETPNTADND